jgi:hypothetical protein
VRVGLVTLALADDPVPVSPESAPPRSTAAIAAATITTAALPSKIQGRELRRAMSLAAAC